MPPVSALAGIHQITLPTPFPVGPVHVYLLEGEPLTLLDTGPATPDALQVLQGGLRDRGYSIGDLQRILISHAHSDHFGLVGELVEASGAEVWAHALARPAVEGWTDYAERRDRFWHDLLAAAGVPPDKVEASTRLYRGFRRLQTYAPVQRELRDQDTIDMAGQAWRVLHCPGHSGSLVCFHQPQHRLLLANDHLLARISSNAIVEPPDRAREPRRRPLIDYWRSLERVNDLDLGLVLPGHGEPVTDPRALIHQRFTFYEKRLARLLAELGDGPRTAWQLAASLFRDLDAVDTFLAVSEVLGHLDVLAAQGQVAVHADAGGPWQYEVAAAALAKASSASLSGRDRDRS